MKHGTFQIDGYWKLLAQGQWTVPELLGHMYKSILEEVTRNVHFSRKTVWIVGGNNSRF